MTHVIMLAPVGSGVGLTSVALGVVRAFEEKGYPVSFFKPIEQFPGDPSQALVQAGSEVLTRPALTLEAAEHLISAGQTDLLLESCSPAATACRDPIACWCWRV